MRRYSRYSYRVGVTRSESLNIPSTPHPTPSFEYMYYFFNSSPTALFTALPYQMMPKSSYLFFKVLYLGAVVSEIFISVNRVFRTKMENETQGINILSLRLWTVSDLAATVVISLPASEIQCPFHQNYELVSNVEKMDRSNKLHMYPMWEICKE